jgi:NTE family protein
MTTRSLVLGGGGITGVAWELGILAGLCDAGVDVTDADTVIGSSAGSVVAAQFTAGAPIEQLYDAQLETPTGTRAKLGLHFYASMASALLRSRDPLRYRKRVGALALKAKTMPEAVRREAIAGLLPAREWPDRRLLITAVDAATGEFVVFERDAGVSLVDAVGASCAVPMVWPPVTIGDRRFIDGGIRSSANADLAEGADRIVVIAPLVYGAGPVTRVADQVRALAQSATVALITPDSEAAKAFGRNVLDPARRAAAARAGRRQAADVIELVRDTWTQPAPDRPAAGPPTK